MLIHKILLFPAEDIYTAVLLVLVFVAPSTSAGRESTFAESSSPAAKARRAGGLGFIEAARCVAAASRLWNMFVFEA